MWGWVVVMFAWGLVINLTGHLMESSPLFTVGLFLMIFAGIVAALFGTWEFLVWSQAWGFEGR